LCEQENKTEISKILEKVEKSKSEVDLLIVSLHWGWKKEHMPMPSKDQVKLGHKIIDQGADIILGHHSHVFQPVELYKGGVIAYSLGNFIFDMWRLENRLGGILEISIYENHDMNITVFPTIIKKYSIERYDTYSEKIEDLIVDKIEPIPNNEKYKKEVRKKKKKHNREFLSYWIQNFYKLSLKVNYCILKETMNRFFKNYSGI